MLSSSRLVRDRLEDLGQQVGLRFIPDKYEVPGPVGVVEDDGPEAIAFQQEQFDLAESDAVGQRILEPSRAEQPAVDSHDPHAGGQSGFIAGHARNDVNDVAVAAEGQADGVLGRDAAASAVAIVVRWTGDVLKAIANAANQVERQRIEGTADPLGQESLPVEIGRRLEESDDLADVIGYSVIARAIPAQEFPAEIIEATSSLGSLPDDGVGFHPPEAPSE